MNAGTVGATIVTKATQQDEDEEDRARKHFLEIAGEDKELDWQELQEVLNYFARNELKGKTFSKDTCRSMIAMIDEDHSGKLAYKEFKIFWNIFRSWKNIFKKFDKDNTGTFSGFELRDALKSAGYELNNHLLSIMMLRYGNKNREIDFDDFIMCVVKLRNMIELFRDRADNDGDRIELTFQQFLETTLYS